MAAFPPRPPAPSRMVPAGPRTASGTPKPVLQETPAERAQALVLVMNRLTDLMALELDAAQQGALDRVAALQTEKQALATRLDETGRLLLIHRAGLAGLAPELLTALEQSSHRLDQITRANAEFLDIQGRAQKCVVDVMVKTLNHERRAGTAYAQLRKGVARPTRAAAPCGSTTFSATL